MKSQVYLTCVLVVAAAALAGCGSALPTNEPPPRKALLVCPAQLSAGDRTEISLEQSSLPGEPKSLSFEWKATPNAGTLSAATTTAPSNSYTAAGQPGAVEISVNVKRGDENVDTARCSIQVVGGVAGTPSPTPHASAAAGAATPDTAVDLDSLYAPSNWMGVAEIPGQVKVDRAYEDNPHSPPNCDKWVVQFRNNTDWAAVGWAFPENNWGDKKGRDLSAFSRLTLWVRGASGQQLVFKTGGHTKPGARIPSSMPEQPPVVVNLSGEWQQVVIPLRGDKSNIPTALVWVAEARRAGGREMSFFVDDAFLEK